MPKQKNLHNELEGLHFDILNDYIEKGTTPNDMEPEMKEYLLQLQFVQQRFDRVESPSNVVKSLMAFFPSLTITTARSRFNDALKFFYLDEPTTKEAMRNILFEICMKAIQLAVKTVNTPETALKIVDAVKKAYEVKGLHLKDEQTIPKELLEAKTEIHSLTPSDVGLPEANRQILAEYIDQFPLKESEKLQLKMDAGVVPREIFKRHEQTED